MKITTYKLPIFFLLLTFLLPNSFAKQLEVTDVFTNNNISFQVGEGKARSIDDEDITPETWRKVKLELKKTDNSVAKVTFLRPIWLLEQAGVKEGGELYLKIPEIGIEGYSKVLRIDSCTVDSRNLSPKYKVVTGTYVHDNQRLLNLCFTDAPQDTLGITPKHPVWSVTRECWVGANELAVGDSVRTKNGMTQVSLNSERPGRHRVFNLEVHKHHTFYVASAEVLTHNARGSGAFEKVKFNVSKRAIKAANKKIKGLGQHMIDVGENGLVPPKGWEGIKRFDTVKNYKGVKYKFEIKVISRYKGQDIGNLRMYGNKNPETGIIEFVKFGTH